ncbi:MAG: histidinol dehydrogenase [Armatimonadota bacterium]|nr:histidinol dehydrogenase [Armatimonadota bacterium]
MRLLDTERESLNSVVEILTRASETDQRVVSAVQNVIADVRARGDEALLELGRKFDCPDLKDLRVSDSEIEEACTSISDELRTAIRTAKANILAFHERQKPNSWIQVTDDYIYGQLVKPIEIVGIYAPAGLAPYPSTVLMTAVPALIAGVSRIIMCTPAQKDGRANPVMVFAAAECGVTEIYKIGGAQAIAAMAYGTQTVPRVHKIVGPGGAYVNEAKRQVFGAVGIDQLAGPSEILILADQSAYPAYVAADLLSQAEHGEDARCVLVTDSCALAHKVLEEIEKQTNSAARQDLIRKSLDSYGYVVVCRNVDECLTVANAFAPEHLELMVRDPWEVLRGIRNAGSIMLGPMTPVPLCDFAAGPNHTLPTGGTARFSSPLGVEDFLTKSGFLSYTREGLTKIAPTVLELASAEGFEAHANTVRIRLSRE